MIEYLKCDSNLSGQSGVVVLVFEKKKKNMISNRQQHVQQLKLPGWNTCKMWGPWAVVRGPSGTKRAAESGKACGITATATSHGETLIWRGRLATPQNPSLALTRLPPHGVTGKPPWRDAKGWHLDRVRYSLMPPSPPHSFHPYAVLTAFVAALLHKISIVTPVMCNGCS